MGYKNSKCLLGGKIKGIKLFELPSLGDDRGELVVVEGAGKQVPFIIKRIFYIYGTTKGTIRGNHANRKSEFLFINVSGSCKIKFDNGITKETISLNKPHEALYMDKMIWKEMSDFSEDAVLIVISNENYDGQEYIRDYNEYLKEVKKYHEHK